MIPHCKIPHRDNRSQERQQTSPSLNGWNIVGGWDECAVNGKTEIQRLETRLWTYPAKEWQHLPRQYLLLSFKYGRSDCDPEVPANSNILWYPGNTLLKVIIIITPAAAKTKGSLCTGACALTTVLWGKYYYCSHFHSEETEAGRD